MNENKNPENKHNNMSTLRIFYNFLSQITLLYISYGRFLNYKLSIMIQTNILYSILRIIH